MALVHVRDMLDHARHHGYAVGACTVRSLEFLEGVLEAAENARAPVILSLPASPDNESHLEAMAAAAETAARRASVPTAIHLEGCTNLSEAIQGINLGCNSIGVAAPTGWTPSDFQLALRIAEMAHGCGVPVTAGIASPEDREAIAQALQAGIDFLSLPAVNDDTDPGAGLPGDVPEGVILSMPGDNITEDALLSRFIAAGIARVDFDTTLMEGAGAWLRNACDEDHIQLYGMRGAIVETAERCLRRCGSEGRASEALTHCASWKPVEHVIIYNVSGIGEHATEGMMAEGRRILSGIPGVRRVVTGKAVKENAAYQYCWLVTFVHPDVIDSYREHPAHVAFADKLFRPVAAERISIDYKTSGD